MKKKTVNLKGTFSKIILSVVGLVFFISLFISFLWWYEIKLLLSQSLMFAEFFISYFIFQIAIFSFFVSRHSYFFLLMSFIFFAISSASLSDALIFTVMFSSAIANSDVLSFFVAYPILALFIDFAATSIVIILIWGFFYKTKNLLKLSIIFVFVLSCHLIILCLVNPELILGTLETAHLIPFKTIKHLSGAHSDPYFRHLCYIFIVSPLPAVFVCFWRKTKEQCG